MGLTEQEKLRIDNFEESYVRAFNGIVFSKLGGVMWEDNLDIRQKELTVRVYSKSMEEMEREGEQKKYRVYDNTFKLTLDLLDSDDAIKKNLYEVINCFENDILHLDS